MRVFKYRGGNFERDMDSLLKNYYWAPRYNDLNDPCETLINSESFKVQSRIFAKLFRKENSAQFSKVEKALHNLFDVKKRGIGIYSLSKTFNDELLWAHYADGHKGFCIEYDLELLVKSYESFETFSFPVIYNKKPPEFGIRDIGNTKSEDLVQKLAGYKSKRWQYEKEYRIVTGFYGEHPYEPSCLKSIYFGLNMNEMEKKSMIQRLKGRNVQFYQIVLKHNSYEFDAVKVNDLTKEKQTYLKVIPKEITEGKPIKFVITRKVYIRNIKGIVEIELESKVKRKQLDWIALQLKRDIFRKVEKLFISYTIKNGSKGEGYWAISSYEKDKLESKINGLTLEQEKSLLEILVNDKRKSLGKWIDEKPYASSGIILVDEKKELFFETIYHDGSRSTNKVTSTKLDDDYTYYDCQPNIHGEHFKVSKDGKLNFYSNDGKYRTLKPFNKNNYLDQRV